jgi:hypothetical protein
MIAYVDASVLLRVALGQPNALPSGGSRPDCTSNLAQGLPLQGISRRSP